MGAGKTLCWAGTTPVLSAIPRPNQFVGRSSPTRLRSEVNSVKEVRIASCTFLFTTFFTRSSPYSIHPQRLSTTGHRETHRAQQIKSGGSDPTFLAFSRPKSSWGRSRPILLYGARVFSPRARQPRSWSPSFLLRVKWASPPYFSPCNFTGHFTLGRAKEHGNHSHERFRRTKLYAAQTVPEAGATPSLDAPCVTVYLGSLPPQATGNRSSCFRREKVLSDALYAAPHTACPTRLHTERRRLLPLLKAQPKQPKSATIQIRVEENVKLRLDKYAEFIDSSPAYVVTEALKLLFNKDGEFRSWLGQQAHNSEGQRHTSKTSMSKGESVQLALK